MEALSSLASGSTWLQSLTPRGCQSHANLHRRPTLREQLFDEKLNPQLLILLVSSHLSVTVSIYQVPNQSSFIGQHRDPQVLIAWGIGKQFVESVGELQIRSCSSNYMPRQYEFTRPGSITVLG
jgi:hypothetical protein